MKGLSPRDVAVLLGVSDRRVRQLVAAGQLDAERVGSQWVIDPASVPVRSSRPGRPFAPRTAWALLLHSDPGAAPWLRADEASRLRAQLRQLPERTDALERVRSWLSARAHVVRLAAPDAADVLSDPRVVPGGVSDQRSRLSAASEAEFYVHSPDQQSVVTDHLLVPVSRSSSNVVMHVSPLPVPEPLPLLAVAIDLADNGGPREYRRAEELFADWLAQTRQRPPDAPEAQANDPACHSFVQRTQLTFTSRSGAR